MPLTTETDRQAYTRATISRGISGEDRYWLTVRGLEPHLHAATSILDVGCGEGHFGGFLRDTMQWKGRLVGTDIHRCPGVSEAVYSHWHEWNLNNPEGLPDELFDMVIACEVLHHAESPRQTVRSLVRCLKPGGRLIFTTANPLSLASLLTLILKGMFRDFQDHPDGWRYPSQLTPILPMDALRMLKECGLEEPGMQFSNRFRIPGTGKFLQQWLPFTSGRWFSDCYRAVGSRKR
jgi:SAM-dependent methyltransferase